MSDIILSDRLRSELEELLAHTPLAKKRCRAQALLWLAEGESVAHGLKSVEGRTSVPPQPLAIKPFERLGGQAATDLIP